METESITLNFDEADVVAAALEEFIVRVEALATDIIENSHMKQAGWNQMDRVIAAKKVLADINEKWPYTVQDEDEGWEDEDD